MEVVSHKTTTVKYLRLTQNKIWKEQQMKIKEKV
jgi:hypothetical protein